MADRFTLRDILVYTIVGLFAILVFYVHFSSEVEWLISETKDYSDLRILILIPLCYLLGHLVMGVDDLIFNNILSRLFSFFKRKVNPRNYLLRFFNFIFFGYRNSGIKSSENIKDQSFLNTCDALIKNGNYEKAEYYQSVGDLFKGILLIVVVSILFRIIRCENFFIELFISIVTWYRARAFSTYYVRFIKREIDRLSA